MAPDLSITHAGHPVTVLGQLAWAQRKVEGMRHHAIEAALRRDESKLRELLGRWVSEIEPVVCRDQDGQIVGLGDGTRIILHWTPGEFTGGPWCSGIRPYPRPSSARQQPCSAR